MKKLFFAILTIVTVSSCSDFQDLEFKGMDGFKVEKMEKRNLSLKIGVKIYNPNSFSLKIKPSTVDVFINDELIGKAFLDENVKIIRKKEDTYFAKIHVELEDGILMKFFKYALKDKVQIRIKGKIKGSVLGITQKTEIDESKEINGSIFKLDKLLNFNN
jgi:LEA14-like dessication related protein